MNDTPLIVNLAPTGMVPTREQSPHVPLSIDEIVADACRCIDLGASMIHLHARGADGTPTTDPRVFAGIITGIRSHAADAVLIATTSGRLIADPGQRALALSLEGEARPDMASLTLGSMNFAASASVNAPATILGLVERMSERGIKPELEVFDLGMVNYAKYLIDRGLLQPPFYFNILLGNLATAQAKLLTLAAILAELPEQSVFSLAGIGRSQRTAMALGATLADGVRVGLEDNLWLDDGRRQFASNADLVRRAVQLATAVGRSIETAAGVRRRLGLGAAR